MKTELVRTIKSGKRSHKGIYRTIEEWKDLQRLFNNLVTSGDGTQDQYDSLNDELNAIEYLAAIYNFSDQLVLEDTEIPNNEE